MFIVRYGEISLKGKNRKRFEELLAKNIEKMLKREGFNGTTKILRGRILVYSPSSSSSVFSKIPGIVSYSPAEEMNYEEIKGYLIEKLRDISPESFKIDAHRVDKRFPKTSIEINEELGEFVVNNFGWRVDLSNPDLRIGVEIINSKAYVFFETYKGIGGLPVGSSGKLMALVSGGIDSPVAAFMMMRRGARIIALHFSINDEEEKVRKYLERLNEFSPEDIELVIFPYREKLRKITEELKKIKRPEWICVFCKYGMVKIASDIAGKKGALGIVTGDSLGQVASQTLENMKIISSASEIPIYRPLIGMDKMDIEKIAKKIGTYDIFLTYGERKCPFRPRYVVTSGDTKKFQENLRKIQTQVF